MIRYLSIEEFAERVGLSANTLKGYRRKDMLPEPDAETGPQRMQGWLPETVDHWKTERDSTRRR